jgi:hypothetical protein
VEKGNEGKIKRNEKKYSKQDLEGMLKRFKMDYKSRKFPLGFMVLLIIGITLLLVYLYILPILEVADRDREVVDGISDWDIVFDNDVTIQNEETYQLTMEGLSKDDNIAISFAVEDNNAPLDSDSGEIDYSFKFGCNVIFQGEESTGEELI